MTLKLRGNAWYLKKTDGEKVREFPLKVFGAGPCCQPPKRRAANVKPCTNLKPCKDRKRALKAAVDMEHDRNEAARKESTVKELAPTFSKLKRLGGDVKAIPTLRDWWVNTAKAFYPVQHTQRRVEHWLTLPFDNSRSWGQARLDEIKKSHCLAALTSRRKQHRRTRAGKVTKTVVSEQTVQNERGYIQAVIQRAMDDELIDRNPWIGIPKPSSSVGRRDEDGNLRLLTPEDEKKLLAALPAREGRWVRFVLVTGMRMEGAMELHADHIVKRNGNVFAHISEKSKDHNNVCTFCKRTGKKCREVPLLSEAQSIIKAQLEEDGALWTNLPGMPSIQKRLAQAARRADIIRISPHDLRFTFGHRWLVAGGSLDDLSRILGHSDTRITRKHYAHLLPDDIADKMRAVMEPNGPKKPGPKTKQRHLRAV